MVIGDTIGQHYQVTALLGAGSMGEVFKGWDQSLNRDVAIKVLKADMGGGEQQRERFRTEAQILAKLHHSNIGSVYNFLEHEVSGYSERQRSDLRKNNIGFIFQSFNLIDELTVFENVELPLIYTKVGSAERKQRVEEVLEKMNMMHRRNHFPQQLSGGQQQRVAVGRAIINNPKLILADEPTGNLDSNNGDDVMKTLVKLNQEGATIIMVTHSQYCAEFGNRIIRMLDGKVVTENIVQQYL